jgi:adenosylcobinamide-GDP ribazoletransferase
MPQFEWKDEYMKYMLCFFPWVGVVIGGCVWLWRMICDRFAIGTLCYAMVGTAIPLLITGGFHVDGFMDTMDAFHSYQSREKKLEILKDSHIGAFAVIMSGLYGMLYIGAFSEVCDYYLLKNICAGFVLARCLSGIGIVSFPSAKKEGMLFTFASNAGKKIVMFSLYLQGALCILFMLWRTFLAGSVTALAAIGSFIYYYFRSKKEFGGITGDNAGYFVLISEGSMVVASAILSFIF